MSGPSLPLGMPATLTPVMAQYKRLKDAHPGCLLFFRLGDFYELFHDDALKAAPVLDVALTRREDVPMCGVPAHAYEAYVPKLIAANFRVAIAEQMEDPASARKRGGRALIEREVVRIITPGTLTEEGFLEARRSNYLAVLAPAGGGHGLAWVDLCEGAPRVAPVTPRTLPALLARLDPGELVAPENLAAKDGWKELLLARKSGLTLLPPARFDPANAAKHALAQYGVASLDGFGGFPAPCAAALGVLVDYVALTQKQAVPLAPPRLDAGAGVMAIDAATRRNLELTQNLSGGRPGSLVGVIDRTLTGPGARLLCEQICAPLCDESEIRRRQDRVAFFVEQAALREKLREALRACPDLPRALARLALKRGGPRDLAAVRAGLEACAALAALLDRGPARNADMEALRAGLGEFSGLCARLKKALKPELPLFARDGNFIARGYAPALDELVTLRDDSRRLIAGLQARYAAATKIANLRIRHNNVIGYHVEVTPSQADRLLNPPHGESFHHRQTLQSGVRFSTVELSELERKLSEADGRALALELQLFEELCGAVKERDAGLRLAIESLAAFDVAAGLADLAAARDWRRPVVDDSLDFDIAKGRHPVVEAALDAPFTPNGCDLGPDRRLWLVTGPNMAGKSTFLRQNALIAVLAQAGSFVPAARAKIGVVDRLFSRVGASDDLARGRSTFMVEMVETAAILNQAGERAFVILDEIGRGTATYDGLSIAWAVVEYLYHACKSRALFATHYHELTALKESLPALHCATARVREWEGRIVFLHEIADGVADRSYGIHVAQLAGLPPPVIERASRLLAGFEKKEGGVTAAPVAAESLAAPARNALPALEAALQALDPDALTPKEALEKLYELKAVGK